LTNYSGHLINLTICDRGGWFPRIVGPAVSLLYFEGVTMGQLWFYGQGEHKLGPYTALQLRDLAVAGKIRVTDTVWKNGIDLGVLADRVKNLFPITLVPLLKAILVPLASPPPSSPEVAVPEAVAAASAERGRAGEESAPVAVPKPANQPSAEKIPPKKLRALAIRGAKITGQDGITLQFRKTCTTCGHEDPSRTSMTIRTGKTRIVFYCPKCRKPRDVEIQGLS
jgi:hypothetical protein